MPNENLIFTIGYDQSLKWFEMLNRKQQVSLKNPNKCNYTCLVWDYSAQELYASDEKGHIYIINVY